jgi:chromosome segregation ATPase
MELTSPPVAADPGAYLIETMPAYIANLVAVRNELAKRQGAITAAEKALDLQHKAEKALDAARAQAAEMLADAAAQQADAREARGAAATLARELDKRQVAFEVETAAKSKELAERENKLASFTIDLNVREAQLADAERALRHAQSEHAAKVKTLQDKVAALAV